MSTTPLGDLIDAFLDLRTTKTELKASLKQIEEDMDEMEQRILNTMTAIGTDTGRTSRATATATETSRYNIEDYDKLTSWILEAPEERIYLFERRLGQNATKELIGINGNTIPGTGLFKKKSISLRKR